MRRSVLNCLCFTDRNRHLPVRFVAIENFLNCSTLIIAQTLSLITIYRVMPTAFQRNVYETTGRP